MIDNKNIILAVVLSIIILVGFDMFFAKDRPAPPPGPGRPCAGHGGFGHQRILPGRDHMVNATTGHVGPAVHPAESPSRVI